MRKLFFHAGILGVILVHAGWIRADINPPPPSTAANSSPLVISMTLEQAIDLALSANRSVRSSKYNLDSRFYTLDSAQSEFELKIAPRTGVGIIKGESLFNAQLAFGKKLTSGIVASIAPGFGKTESEYASTVGMELQVPLLKGFGRETNLDNVNRSRYFIKSADHSLFVLKVNTVLDTVRTVYEIINQKDQVQLFQSHAEQLKRHVASARVKESVGLASPIDTYRANIRLKDVEDNLTRVKEAFTNAQDALKLILSVPQEQQIQVSAPLNIEPVRLDLDTAVTTALENRVELTMARDHVDEAERVARVAKKNTLPELNLVLNYEALGTSAALSDSLTFGDHVWGISLESNTDWFRRSAKADFQKSLLAVNVANLGYASRQDEIKREVRLRLSELDKSETRMDIIREQIHQAEGKLALAKVKFNHGMADNFDVIESETQLQQAHSTLLIVTTNYIVGTYRLRSAMGTLLERSSYKWQPYPR